MDGALARLYVATFLYSLSMAVGVPLVPEFLKLDFGAGAGFIGAVLGLYGLMQVVLRLPMGDLADRRGRKPSLLLAFACVFASGVLFVLAANEWWAFPAVAFFGLAGGIYWVAANSYLFDRVGEGDVAKATSDYSIALGLALLVGPPLGHVVADHLGFRAAFATFLGVAVLGALLVATLPETPPKPRPRPSTSPYRRAWGLLRHPALVLSAIGTLLYSTLFSTMNAFFQLHALAVGVTVTAIGFLLGGRQAVATLMRLWLPNLLRRVGPERLLFAGVVVMALSVAAVPWAGSIAALVVVVGVAGAATGVMIPSNLMLVHKGAPPDERGLANGIYGTMLGLGSAVAPAAFGPLGDRLGLAWTFWAAAAAALLLLVAMLAFRRRAPSG